MAMCCENKKGRPRKRLEVMRTSNQEIRKSVGVRGTKGENNAAQQKTTHTMV